MKTIKIKHYSDIPENFTGIVEFPNGDKAWYKEGILHRENGPACEYPNGTKYWYKEGKWHREDGPAIEMVKRITTDLFDFDHSWYLEGHHLVASYDPIKLYGNIILSKDNPHPVYSSVKIWKILDKDKIFDLEVVPGMEEYIWI